MVQLPTKYYENTLLASNSSNNREHYIILLFSNSVAYNFFLLINLVDATGKCQEL